jgi:hypothetical protein
MMDETFRTLAENIQNTIGDAFKDLFKGSLKDAEEFMNRLKDVILNSLADLAAAIIQRPLNVVINTVMGTAASSAAGAAGQAAGGTAGLGGLGGGGFSLSGIGANISSYATNIGLGIEKALFNTPWSDFGTSIANGLASTSSISLVGGGLGGGIAAGFANNMLFGDSLAVDIGGGIGSAAGTILGAALTPVLGPLGPLLGSFLGGVAGGGIGSLFGGGKPANEYGTLGLSGEAGFQIGKLGKGERALSQEAAEKLQAYFDSLNSELMNLAGVLGADFGEAVNRIWDEGKWQGLTTAHMETWVADMTQQLIDELFEMAPDLGDATREVFQQAFEAGGLEGIQAAMQAINQLGDSINAMTPGAVEGAAGVEMMAEALLVAGANAEALLASTAVLGNYMNRTRSESEKLALATDAVEKTFADLGLSVPESTEQMRELIQSIDWTTEEGQALGRALAAVLPDFELYIQGIEATADAAEEAAAALQQAARDMREMVQGILALGSEESQLRAAQHAAEDIFGRFGYALPKTQQEFEAFWDSILTKVQEGDKVAEAFYKEWAGEGLDYAAGKNAAAWVRSLEDVNNAVEGTAGTIRSSASAIRKVAAALPEVANWKLQVRLLELLGRGEEALALQRENELAALNVHDRVLQTRIWALEDEAAAAEAAAKATAEIEKQIQSYVDALINIQRQLDQTRQGIEEFGLKPEEIYKRRKEEADRLMDALGEMTDPGMIEDTVSRINQLIGEGWGILDEGQKGRLQDSFLGYLDEIEQLAEERLSVGLAPLLPEADVSFEGTVVKFAGIMDSLDGSLASSSDNMSQAGSEMKVAAGSIVSAASSINAAARAIPSSITVKVKQTEVD